MKTEKERFYYIFKRLVLLFTLLSAYYIFYVITGIGVPCLFNKITGLYCTGCGTTRMLVSLLRLDIKSAINSNAFNFFFLPFMMGVGIYKLVKFVKVGISDDPIILRIFYFIFFILATGFGVLRNFSFFSFLAPH
ncbi:MAG: DUF2752 domain-containing protein [Clostridia bacterium]|nr:DUF2752 domain-containing protein [Clostridia bacterium]